MTAVPGLRIRTVRDAPLRRAGDYVLYWMTAARRTRANYGLQRAIEHARALQRPLLILEALRCDYPWASDRLHAFVLQGMADNTRACAGRALTYYPYVEPAHGAGRGLLAALGARACVVVGDEFPGFFLPHMLEAAATQLPVRLEAVDSNGLLPLRAAATEFPTAYAFRRFLQRHLPEHLAAPPLLEPLAGLELPRLRRLPDTILRSWPAATPESLAAGPAALRALPVDHTIAPAASPGGASAAAAVLRCFLARRMADYRERRGVPDHDTGSSLSPYLHFGHLAAHEVLAALARREDWSPDRLADSASGHREGWWRLSSSAEAFLDQLVTWRELGYQFCHKRADYDQYAALPAWAKASLDAHARDPRPFVYRLARFERAETHDELWNATQRQLLREGRIHNYLRMLWGKKVLEWTRRPQDALAMLIELNNKYALDGRDPNSYSGIFWCFGRFDRPWAPKRPIFGVVRYMSSENTRRKTKVKEYLKRYGA